MSQADSPNTTNLSRRRLLGAFLATAAVTAPVVATAMVAHPAAANPDADLIKLMEEWFAARDEAARLSKAFAPHEEAWFAQRRKLEPQMPEALRVRPDDVEIGIPERRADDGAYRMSHKIDHLRDDQWLYTCDNRTEDDGVENFLCRHD
jgi:hypothetical protein